MKPKQLNDGRWVITFKSKGQTFQYNKTSIKSKFLSQLAKCGVFATKEDAEKEIAFRRWKKAEAKAQSLEYDFAQKLGAFDDRDTYDQVYNYIDENRG